jgi:hypothetical protein
MQDGAQVVTWLRNGVKKYEKRRKFFTEPINDYLKKVNSLFKQWTVPLDEADCIVTGKIIAYREAERKRIEQENARIEQERKAELKRIAEKQAEADAQFKRDHPDSFDLAPEIEVPEPCLPVESLPARNIGTGSFRKQWTFEITNIDSIPDLYWSVNTTLIQKSIDEGLRVLPGIRIFEKEYLIKGR